MSIFITQKTKIDKNELRKCGYIQSGIKLRKKMKSCYLQLFFIELEYIMFKQNKSVNGTNIK